MEREQPLLRTIVGDVLRRRRQDQHRTLAEVAQAASVSTQYLSELERGRKEASSEVLASICDSLDLELADLLGEVREELTASRVPVGAFKTVVNASVLRLDTARLQRRPMTQHPIAQHSIAQHSIAQHPMAQRPGDVLALAA